MKKFGVLGIGLLALSTACSGSGFGGDSPSYSGKIIDWPAEKTGFIQVAIPSSGGFVVSSASTAVDGNGNFTNLPFPASASFTPAPSTAPCTDAVWNPSTVKSAAGLISVVNNAKQETGLVVEGTKNFNASGNKLAVGDKQVLRFYVDTNATLKGTCISGNPASTTVFDINLTAGWNIVVLEVTKVSGTTLTEARATSGSLPSDSKLFYSAGGSNTLSFNNLFK